MDLNALKSADGRFWNRSRIATTACFVAAGALLLVPLVWSAADLHLAALLEFLR